MRYTDVDKTSYFIDREAFKEKYLCFGYLPEISEKEFNAFPTADVALVVHGYWKPIYPDKIFEHQNRAKYYECSVCGRNSADEGYSNGLDYEFCPYCGAVMDGKEES